MIVSSSRLGEIELRDGWAVHMPRGMAGFGSATRFHLFQRQQDIRFHWLQSTDCPDLAFWVVDPHQFFAGYEVEMEDDEASLIGVAQREDVVMLVVVTLAGDDGGATANLMGPIVVNATTGSAVQLALQDQHYTTKHALPVSRVDAASQLQSRAA